jgi:hypothetical protein
MRKSNIIEQILNEKLKYNPNYNLIRKLQQKLDEEQKTKSSRRTRD